MTPLHLLVHADTPENVARIERALHVGAPGCTTRVVADADQLAPALASHAENGAVVATSSDLAPVPAAQSPSMSPALRHELNNHLALIRMLADFLADSHSLPSVYRAKAQEIGTAAEAAAQAIRRTKSST